MSVIVIRNGIIAADTQGSIGHMTASMGKLETFDDIAIGFCGGWTQGKRFCEWYKDGANMESLPEFPNVPDGKPAFVALVLKKDGTWEYWDEEFYRDTNMCEVNEYIAIGSGREIAMGALHMGASAIEAAEAACALMSSCGLPVEHYDASGKPSIKFVSSPDFSNIMKDAGKPIIKLNFEGN